MSKKKVFWIIFSVFFGVIFVLFLLSFIGGSSDNKDTTQKTINTDSTLTESDKTEIESKTKEFIEELGNYGWYPNIIKNPETLLGDDFTNKLMKQKHTTVEDSQKALRSLTNSTKFDDDINKLSYSVPFSVETETKSDIVVPDKPKVEGDETFVPVTVPIKSTVSYIANTIGYFDQGGTWHDSEKFVQQFFFEGDLNLKFINKDGGWYINDFSDTVGVLATDPMSFTNGDLVSDFLAQSSNKIKVQ